MTGKGGIENDNKALWLVKAVPATTMKHTQLSTNWSSKLRLTFYFHWKKIKKKLNEHNFIETRYESQLWL